MSLRDTAEQADSQVTVTVALQDGGERVSEFGDRCVTGVDRLQPGLQWRLWPPFENEQLTDSMNDVVGVAVETTRYGTATVGSESNAVGGASTATRTETVAGGDN